MKLHAPQLTPTSARHAALLNQLATPGLGTLLAGKIALGISQLVLAFGGFCGVAIWFVSVLRQYYGQISGTGETKAFGWVGLVGGALFAVAWVWALVTSIGLLLKARPIAPPTAIPPLISP